MKYTFHCFQSLFDSQPLKSNRLQTNLSQLHSTAKSLKMSTIATKYAIQFDTWIDFTAAQNIFINIFISFSPVNDKHGSEKSHIVEFSITNEIDSNEFKVAFPDNCSCVTKFIIDNKTGNGLLV